jgi:hypothetical protein
VTKDKKPVVVEKKQSPAKKPAATAASPISSPTKKKAVGKAPAESPQPSTVAAAKASPAKARNTRSKK